MSNKSIINKKINYPNKIHIILDEQRDYYQLKEPPHPQNNIKPPFNNSTVFDKYKNIVRELEKLVGLEEIKQLIFEIFALIHIGQRRSELGLKNESQVFHMIFKGNPGTGKTTVARIMVKMFKEMGILSKGHLVEVERADLVGEYIGHTAQKTKEQVKKALGGILFIDEAYSLLRGGEKDFGRESIDTLVKAMEDYKNDFVLILAGYSLEMEAFIQANPGIYSRFPIQLNFPDYSNEQLMAIAEIMMKERDYLLSITAKQKLRQILMTEKNNPFQVFSNARLVRNWIEKAIRNHAVRLLKESNYDKTKQTLMAIQPEDFLYQKHNMI